MAGRIIKLDDVTFTEPSLPTIEVSDDDIYLASFPGLRVWFDPQAKYELTAGELLRDRMQSYPFADGSGNGWTIDAAGIGGRSAMVLDKNSLQAALLSGYSAHPTGTYTKVLVVRPGVIASQGGLISAIGGTATFRLNGTGTLAVAHGAESAATTEVLSSGADYVVMACYNADTQAVAIYINGTKAALGAQTIGAPVTPDGICVGFVSGFGQYFDGAIGDAMVFDADYGLPEYASHRAALFDALMGKYSIA